MMCVTAFLKYWDGDAVQLAALPILVVSQRMQQALYSLGFQSIWIADSAYSQDVLASLVKYKADFLMKNIQSGVLRDD